MYIYFSNNNYFIWKWEFNKILYYFYKVILYLIKGNTYKVFYHFACLLYYLKQFHASLYFFNETKKIYPSTDLNYSIAILNAIVKQNYEYAKEMLELYISDNEKDWGALYWLGCIYMELADFERAFDSFSKIDVDSEYGVDALVRLGSISENDGDKEKAKQLYMNAFLMNNDHYFALVGLARIELSNNNLINAKNWLIKAIKTWKMGPEANYLLESIKDTT